MDQNVERQILVAEYLSLSSILRHKGLDFVEIPDDQLDTMPVRDLRPIVQNMMTIARTPMT